MKRAFSTVACMNDSFAEVIRYAKLSGISAVEIRLDNNGCICGVDETGLMECIQLLKENEIIISDLGTSVALFGYEPEKINQAQKAIDLAECLGAKGIRLFLTRFMKWFSEPNLYDYEGIVKALKELCCYALEKQVEIWIETHNAFSTGKSLKILLQDVGCKNMKIIWDIMHSIEMGESPEETWAYIGEHIAHVHIKDGMRPDDTNAINYIYTKLGEGELPIREILALLKKNAYDGYLSLEWENAWRKEIRGVYTDMLLLLADFNKYMDE